MRKDKDKTERGQISRRDFLIGAGSVVVGGAIGAGITYPLVAGKEVEKTKTVEVTKTVTGPATTVTTTAAATTVTSTVAGPTKTVTTTVAEGVVEPAFEPEETVIHAHNLCGFSAGGELGAVDVKDGRIVRIRPLHYDAYYTKEELAPSMWKFEARGKSFEPSMKGLQSYFASAYKKQVYSPNRIKYPLKRVDWDPNGERNTQNRGKSKFKRISWDEATDIIVNEITRVQETYGPYAVLLQADGHGEAKTIHGGCHGCNIMLFQNLAGYTLSVRNPDSWEGWYYGSMHIWGSGAVGLAAPTGFGVFASVGNILKDVSENTDMLVWEGGDMETTPQGFGGQMGTLPLYWFTDLGIKQVFISPELNYAGAVHADKWIPVLPNTDIALSLAIIYTWIDEDLYDKDYVETHTVGFDKIKAHVLGEEDGIPKTPAWASPRCGVPAWTIKALARDWAAKRTTLAHYFGGPMIRGPYCHETCRFLATQICMQGMGKPGVHQLHYTAAMPRYSVMPNTGTAGRAMMYMMVPTPQIIPKPLQPEAIMNPPWTFWGSTALGAPVEDQFVKYTYPIPEEEGGTEIHMIWCDNPCHIGCWNNGNMRIEAYRNSKIECIVYQHPWLQNDCLFGDIILPISTMFEEDDIMASQNSLIGSHIPSLAITGAAIKPIGESMSDYEAVGEVAKKLGLEAEYTGGKTVEEWIREGYETSNVKDLISWEEFSQKGFYIPPVAPDWEEDPPGFREFYEDPEGNPIALPSGKLEFYSDRLAESFPDDRERGPYPKYITGGPGWTLDENLDSEKAKEYPLVLISNHPRWREHVTCDDIPWLREIPTCKVKGYDGYNYEAVWLHPTTAAERGIESGDIVKIYNDRGIVLGGAYVTQRIKPGAVYMDHAAKIDYITDKIDRGGSIDQISPTNAAHKYIPAVMIVSGYLVEVEKLDPAEMEDWRKKFPEAFAREYDPAYGLKFSAWVEGGM